MASSHQPVVTGGYEKRFAPVQESAGTTTVHTTRAKARRRRLTPERCKKQPRRSPCPPTITFSNTCLNHSSSVQPRKRSGRSPRKTTARTGTTVPASTTMMTATSTNRPFPSGDKYFAGGSNRLHFVLIDEYYGVHIVEQSGFRGPYDVMGPEYSERYQNAYDALWRAETESGVYTDPNHQPDVE